MFLRILLVVMVGLLVAGGVVFVFQRRLIYFPSQALPSLPTLLLDAEEVAFSTEDGLTLAAWWVPPTGEANGATILLLNGNAGNRADRAPLATQLSDRGFAILLVDYRGYGGNPGNPTEGGLIADAEAAAGYLLSRPDVDPDRLVYFGESLGAAVALGLAEQLPPAAIVLRSPFTSLSDVASVHYPLLPASILLWDRYPNLERIPRIDAPVLVVAGTDDDIVPRSQSRRLFDAANEPKQFLTIEGAGHNDHALVAGRTMLEAVARFVDGAIGTR